ncbi:hypothetical protein MGSAQ_002022, partial [marine sediment metagenome]
MPFKGLGAYQQQMLGVLRIVSAL